MLAAILRGKISSKVERSEDLLTSVVFGALEHLPVDAGVARFIALALQDVDVGAGIPTPSSFSMEYWPWWYEDEAPQGAEPDLALWLDTQSGRHLLVVEAKRASGKSGHGSRDQLARQATNGRELAVRTGAQFLGIIYLTAHLVRPVADIQESHEAMRAHFGMQSTCPIWWVSWRDMVEVLDDAGNETVAGTLALQAAACLRKWGLVWFRGVSEVPAFPEYSFERTT